MLRVRRIRLIHLLLIHTFVRSHRKHNSPKDLVSVRIAVRMGCELPILVRSSTSVTPSQSQIVRRRQCRRCFRQRLASHQSKRLT